MNATMTANWEMDRVVRYYDSLEFGLAIHEGDKVFVYIKSEYRWKPAWVVDMADGSVLVQLYYGERRMTVPKYLVGVPMRDGCRLR